MAQTLQLPSAELTAHRRHLYAYALRRLRSPDAAEDAVQETFAAALTDGDGYAGRSALRTWLTGILNHKIMDEFRRQAKAPVSLDEDDDGESAAVHGLAERLGGDAPLAANEPEYAAARNRFWAAFEQHLERMPARTARAFAMSEVMGHDTAEVCEALGVTRSNLWVMLHRARKTLQTAVEPGWKQYFGAPR